MRQTAVLRTPQTIRYGRYAFEEVGKEAVEKGRKALIISDEIMDNLGYVQKCQEYLANENVGSAYYLGVQSEPTDLYVDEAWKVFISKNCDIIISLGGGSCIDTAKAVAVLASNGGYIGDYMGGKRLARKDAIPHIAIPTTAGTGSEATDATIITNTSTDVKMMIKQAAFMPSVAIVDPLLSVSSPKSVTAATGIDALSHAIEGYISKRAHPMTDMLALSAMELIIGNIETAYEDGSNLPAREAMALGALQAGMAFSNASVCLVHGMSRPIGALFHVPHGFSNAMLLPAVLEFSKEGCTQRLASLGRYFRPDAQNLADSEAADLAVTSVKKLCLDLQIPNLKDWGIDEGEFKSAISKMARDALMSGSPQNNPKVPSQGEIEELYRVCYNYDFSEASIKL